MVAQLAFQKPSSLRFAHFLEIVPPVLSSDLVGAWRFNKASGETDAQAAARCSWNMAPGASNAASARRWPGGLPTFSTTHARFTNGAPLVTAVPDFGTAGGCAFVVARTQDTTIGVGSLDRGFMVGSYGGNTNRGWGLEFASYSSGTARAIDYNAAGSVATNQVTTATNDLPDWRIWYFETGRVSGSNALLAAINLNPADGSGPDPADTTLTGGRSAGAQTVTIGGRVSDSASTYTAAVHKDIALVLVFDALPSGPQRATLGDWVASLAADAGLTLGAA